jgi:hypothetical protein
VKSATRLSPKSTCIRPQIVRGVTGNGKDEFSPDKA